VPWQGTIEQTGGRMKFNVTCPRCHGTGKNISTCPVCHGEGSVERTDPLEIRIKAGTRDGQRIRIAGKGNAGLRGGGVGDLYVIIRMGEHPLFRREGDDIYITVPVTAVEAALGSKIEVPTIDGRSMLKIPPGTQSGQKLRLRDKGVPSATKDDARGDEIVEVKITVPMPRDEKTKELLRELAKLNPEDPRAELWGKSRISCRSSVVNTQLTSIFEIFTENRRRQLRASLLLARVIRRIDIIELHRRHSVDLHHGRARGHRIVVHVGIEIAKAARRKRHHFRLIEFVAHAKLESA